MRDEIQQRLRQALHAPEIITTHPNGYLISAAGASDCDDRSQLLATGVPLEYYEGRRRELAGHETRRAIALPWGSLHTTGLTGRVLSHATIQGAGQSIEA